MKKSALLLSMIALSATAQANQWKHLDFPVDEPYYHSVNTMDDEGTLNIDIACMEAFKTRIVTLKGIDGSFEDSSIKFYPSSKDKVSKIIEGSLTLSEDGIINVITGETAEDLVSYFKLLHSVNAEIKKTDETVVKYSFDLTGSSKALNMFEAKCDKLNK